MDVRQQRIDEDPLWYRQQKLEVDQNHMQIRLDYSGQKPVTSFGRIEILEI